MMKLPTNRLWTLLLTAVLTLGQVPAAAQAETAARTLTWDDLFPENFDLDGLIETLRQKYDIDNLSDDDPRIYDLQEEVDAVLNETPVNDALNGTRIRLPGYVIPLESDGETTREFLLVPYFGACIHVPPPPANQTVHVTTRPGAEARIRQMFDTVWVTGEIRTERLSTELAEAGYRILASKVEPYEE